MQSAPLHQAFYKSCAAGRYGSDPELEKGLDQGVDTAHRHTSEVGFHKMTRDVRGRPRIMDRPPLIYHLDASKFDLKKDIVPFFEVYRDTLSLDRQVSFSCIASFFSSPNFKVRICARSGLREKRRLFFLGRPW